MEPATHSKKVPPLDSGLYALDEDSSEFFKSLTCIHDDVELKKHILKIQAQAYAVAPYPCIRSFNFTRPKISKVPAYQDALKLGQDRKGALLLDIGCCFGTDARQAARDGFPAKQIIASDLRQELWELGHMLFRSSPESFPATFVAGNALDPTFLSPFKSGADLATKVDLFNIRTLNDLRGKISAIWATSFFHLFSEQHQYQLAHALGSLLSPESDSVIFGSHLALPKKGILVDDISNKSVKLFCHDPDSWNEMWVGQSIVPSDGADPADNASSLAPVFSHDSVRVAARLVPVKSEPGEALWFLVWSVTRI